MFLKEEEGFALRSLVDVRALGGTIDRDSVQTTRYIFLTPTNHPSFRQPRERSCDMIFTPVFCPKPLRPIPYRAINITITSSNNSHAQKITRSGGGSRGSSAKYKI